MEIILNVQDIENIDSDVISVILLTVIIQRDELKTMKILPFLYKMSDKKIRLIWLKIKKMLNIDDKKWFKSLIKNF